MNEASEQDGLAQTENTQSRRAVLGSAAAVIGVTAYSNASFAFPASHAPPAPATYPPAEGFFLRFQGAGPADTRLFFISSELLAYCEITDLYEKADKAKDGAKKKSVIAKFEPTGPHSGHVKAWDVL